MKTKYPILLVHGMAAKDILFVKAFGKIEKMLKSLGYIVYSSKIDSFGTVENNSLQLKKEIEEILKKENTKKINIIGHSKGGLDSKFMIHNHKMGNKVASLTTLCTPHKGSAIASKILTHPRWILKIIAFWIDLFYKIIKDKKPNCLKVCEQLSKEGDIANSNIKLPKNVYCQSYSTIFKKSRNDPIMGVPLIFTKYLEKGTPSDGVVTEESAMFGEYKGNAFTEDISHSQITDILTNKKQKQKIHEFYRGLVHDLALRGY